MTFPSAPCPVLAAGSFRYTDRLPAVATALAIPDIETMTHRDRVRLLAALFDLRVAPHTVEVAS